MTRSHRSSGTSPSTRCSTNRARLTTNAAAREPGPDRDRPAEGPALLSVAVVCGPCGGA